MSRGLHEMLAGSREKEDRVNTDDGKGSQPPAPRSDRELLDAARKGEMEAFETLYMRNHRVGLRLAYRCTGSSEGAEEILQDAVTDLLAKLRTRSIRGSFRTYFWKMIRNKAATWCRTRKRERERSNRRPGAGCRLPPELSPEEAASLLDQLPPEQREVLKDHYLEGRSIRETAEAHRLSVGTVQSRCHRGLVGLRGILKNSGTRREGSGD